MYLTKACVIIGMTSVELAIDDAGQGIVMGKKDAIDWLVVYFFKSNY